MPNLPLLDLPSPAYLIASLVFSLAGWIAWRRGRQLGRPSTRWLGLALMLYPMAVSDTALLVAIGAALCGAIVVLERGLGGD